VSQISEASTHKRPENETEVKHLGGRKKIEEEVISWKLT
jgi:hypothetical protein